MWTVRTDWTDGGTATEVFKIYLYKVKGGYGVTQCIDGSIECFIKDNRLTCCACNLVGMKSPFRIKSELSTHIIVDSSTILTKSNGVPEGRIHSLNEGLYIVLPRHTSEYN